MPPPQHPEELMQHRCLYARTLLGGNRWGGFSLNNIATVVEIKDALECDNSEMLCDLALQGGLGLLIYLIPLYIIIYSKSS